MLSSQRPSLTVGVAFDDAYLLPGLIALISAAKALPGEVEELVVMTNVGASSLELIAQVEKRQGMRIRTVRPSEVTAGLSHLPHLSPMTNARLDLRAWSINTDQFLYLDSDTFTVRRPRLPGRLPDGIAVAGAIDAVIPTHGHLARLRRDLSGLKLFSENSEEVYVNAGVLLIDVGEWQRQGLGNVCMKLMTSYPQLSDQDAINLALAGNKVLLTPCMNAQTADRSWRRGRRVGGKENPAGKGSCPVQVVHFTADKPWKCMHPRPSHAKWMKFLLGQLPRPAQNGVWLSQSLWGESLKGS